MALQIIFHFKSLNACFSPYSVTVVIVVQLFQSVSYVLSVRGANSNSIFNLFSPKNIGKHYFFKKGNHPNFTYKGQVSVKVMVSSTQPVNTA